MKQKVVIGITGGIAAYKIIDLIKLLKNEYSVEIILTNSAEKIIDVNQIKKLRIPLHINLFEEDFNYQAILKNRKVKHIEVADSADIIVIAPATANIIAKLAAGIADDFLTTTILGTGAPILICPSMNVNMWFNPTLQNNLKKLSRSGFYILPPEAGDLACGYTGMGRLTEIKKIKKEIDHIVKKRNILSGKKIIITSGATGESIDAARVITSKSSGKMGNALAKACIDFGADVLLLRSTISVSPDFYVAEKTFETSADLLRLIKKYTPSYDIIFHAAAVSDFALSKKIPGKLDSKKSYNIKLIPTEKIIGKIKKINPKIKLIAFKAEYKISKKTFAEIWQKLSYVNPDAIILNDISRKDRGFASDNNEVYILQKNKKPIKIPLSSKKEIARSLLDELFLPLFKHSG